MFENKLDILAIGDLAIDTFIKIKNAGVNCDANHEHCKLCLNFGDKVPYELVETIYGVGNSANVAISAKRLGLQAGIISDIGDDENGKKCLSMLKDEGVKTEYVSIQKNMKTNCHFVLWYGTDRTILVKHEEYIYHLSEINPPKWIYLTSLPAHAETYQEEIVNYLKKHQEINLVFQPGTFQIKLGRKKLAHVYEKASVLLCNKDEAERILEEKGEIKILLEKLAEMGPKIVIITDEVRGSYMRENGQSWFMRSYPDKNVIERTGAGDAFSSTFVSALILGKSPLEAIKWAPINALSVIQYIGPQKGLLTKEAIEKMLENAPEDYKPVKI